MKKYFLLAMVLCLVAPIGLAQVSDRAPHSNSNVQTVASSNNATLALGDLNWELDIEGLTGDIRLLGVCYDPVTGHIWCTGAFDFTIAYLYEVDFVNGVLVNTYTQPTTNWGAWGWRDLCSDGQYLYTGDDTTNPGYITQIDPKTGTPTGVNYGPYPVVPCRALAYDPVSDCFWTASFSSSVYQCFRDGTYNTFGNPGVTAYGAAMEETNNMVWWWSQSGATGTEAFEYDPATQSLTGQTFAAQTTFPNGMAGGAGCREVGGNWEIIGMVQSSPDHVGAFDLDVSGVAPALKVSPDVIDSRVGGTVTFDLNAGAANAGRFYVIFAGASGSTPGTPLPGGSTVLPVNWDAVTNLMLGLPFFYGNLDGTGSDMKSLPVVPFFLAGDLVVTFAYALNGPPWDFASNPEELTVLGEPDEYIYDDGTTENLLGWTSGGEMCWMHYFDAAGGDTITEIATAFGSALYTGYNPGNGTPATLYIWDDPTNDNDMLDAVLLQSMNVTVVNVDTDMVNYFTLTTPQPVTGGFFVGAMQNHNAGQFVAPMDQSNPVNGGEAWYAGVPAGLFDPNTLGNNTIGNFNGFPAYLLLRAK
jgi:hypothetical protein